MNKNAKTSFIVFFSFIIGSVFMYSIIRWTPLFQTNTTTTIKDNSGTTVVEKNSLSTAVAKAYDSVVMIQGYKNEAVASTGTGFVYKIDDKYAYLMTNHHVISEMETVEIINSNDEQVEAKVLGSDEYLDLAVIRIDVKYAKGVVEIGDSTTMNVGDTVFTIGSPMGYDYRGTVTSGILSGKDRLVSVSVGNSNSSDWVMKVLQTDAAINPGNSGGPLLNVNGQVIGINSMKLVQEEIEGMGFAISIEYAMAHVDSLEKGKDIEWPVLGISMINASDKASLYRNNISIDSNITSGVVIVQIAENTSASKSDLKVGDVITKINNEEAEDLAHLRYELYKYNVGDTIEVTYIRDGKEKTCKVELSKSSN